MKARKYKQRWAKLNEAEQALLADIGQPMPEGFPPTKTAPDGSLWADPVLLAAYRSQHTSLGDDHG